MSVSVSVSVSVSGHHEDWELGLEHSHEPLEHLVEHGLAGCYHARSTVENIVENIVDGIESLSPGIDLGFAHARTRPENCRHTHAGIHAHVCMCVCMRAWHVCMYACMAVAHESHVGEGATGVIATQFDAREPGREPERKDPSR